MSYRITITQIVERVTNSTSWNKVADSGNPKDGGAQYEYVPTGKLDRTERQVLVQDLDDIDLAAVIKAVNKL